MAIINVIGGVMRGAGDTIAPLFLMVACNIVFRIPFTMLIVHLSKSDIYPNGDPKMIFYANLTSFILHVIASLIYFRTGRWKTKAVVKLPPNVTEAPVDIVDIL